MPAEDNLCGVVKFALFAFLRELGQESDWAGFNLSGPYTQIQLNTGQITFACWVVSTDDNREEQEAGDSGWHQWILPVNLKLLDRRGPRDDTADMQYRFWRQQMVRALHQRRPLLEATAGSCYWCEVRPGPPYDTGKAEFQDTRSLLVVRCWVREPRYGPTLPAPLVAV